MPSFIIVLLCQPAPRKPRPDFTQAPSRKMRRNTDVDRGAGVELRVRENPTDDRHGIVGYLDDPNIAKKILDALDV